MFVIGIVAIAGGGIADAARAGARAQVDPYTGGVVAPPQSCAPGAVHVSPGGILTPGQAFTLSTTGQRPNSSVNFYVAGELVNSVTADPAGAASIATQAPKGFQGDFMVAVAGACGTVTALVDPRAAALGAPFGRGFARTGFALLPLVLLALALIVVGRRLAGRAQKRRLPTSRSRTPARPSIYRVAHPSTRRDAASTR